MEEKFNALLNDDVLTTISNWTKSGHKAALATVIDTWGSSPRPVGSQLGINDKGELVGSVSGGCIEGAVAKQAFEVVRTLSWSLRLYLSSSNNYAFFCISMVNRTITTC